MQYPVSPKVGQSRFRRFRLFSPILAGATLRDRLLACLGEKTAMPDAETSVNWTMVGICAHQSALNGGEKIKIPQF